MVTYEEMINEILGHVFTPEQAEAWWNEPMPCLCSIPHPSRREIHDSGPDGAKVVLELARLEYELQLSGLEE